MINIIKSWRFLNADYDLNPSKLMGFGSNIQWENNNNPYSLQKGDDENK